MPSDSYNITILCLLKCICNCVSYFCCLLLLASYLYRDAVCCCINLLLSIYLDLFLYLFFFIYFSFVSIHKTFFLVISLNPFHFYQIRICHRKLAAREIVMQYICFNDLSLLIALMHSYLILVLGFICKTKHFTANNLNNRSKIGSRTLNQSL